jgi:hypothetical protein
MALPYVAIAVGLYGLSNAWVAILLYDVGIVLLLAWSGAGDMSRLVHTGWDTRTALVMSAVCVSGGAAIYVLWKWVALPGAPFDARLAVYGLSGWKLYAFLAWLAVVHPVLEEIHWRGRLLVGDATPAARDAIFAAYHVLVLRIFVRPLWVVFAFAVLLLTAWVWRRVAIRTGGLAIPVVSHIVADISVAIAVVALLQ